MNKKRILRKARYSSFTPLKFKSDILSSDFNIYKNKCKCLEYASTLLKLSKPGALKKLREKEEAKIEKWAEELGRSTGRPKPLRGRPNLYPDSSEILMQVFHIPWNAELSWVGKLTLNGFQKKHLYYAVDDILYAPNMSLKERDDLLALLYSPALSLHNTCSINFFDIWIHELNLQKILKKNRFLKNKFPSSYQITIKVLYKIRPPRSKPKSLW